MSDRRIPHLYVDSSALGKLLQREVESEALKTYLRTHDPLLATSELTCTELLRQAGRAGVPHANAEALLETLVVVRLDRAALLQAGRLPPHGRDGGPYLRSADAIHLVSALRLGISDFLTYDHQQARAALAHGFRVVAPS